ncbi:hypothetical protein PLO_0710 [Pediococcus acidilactici NGRI 0510Q]|nr:hypothetical protein PLO_0710 [Pediococcus acidilactici NGRI 0510Q]
MMPELGMMINFLVKRNQLLLAPVLALLKSKCQNKKRFMRKFHLMNRFFV